MTISLERIVQSIRTVAYRFPVAMLAALVGTTIGILLVHEQTSDFSTRLLLTAIMGFPLFIALQLLTESFALARQKKIALIIGGGILLLLYYFWLPNNFSDFDTSVAIRSVLWFIGFWLLVLFAPHARKAPDSSNMIWRHIQELVYAAVITALWALVIGWGISAALASIDFLFNAGIAPERYGELAVIVAGLFSTTFFLSRIPTDFKQTVGQDNYPKEARLLSQYALVPLVSLYFLILYAYVIRVLLLWEWPKGTLAYMILGFSALGILVYAILSPLRQSVPWVRKAGIGFFIALIPQIGMLFWALMFRISEYGITENRYYVAILGLWLVAMALYFLRSTQKDIRTIPITLFLIAFLSSFGPWGALAISKQSQIHRLQQLLDKNGLIVNGVVEKSPTDIQGRDGREISGIIFYLNEVHGLASLEQMFSSDVRLSTTEKQERPKKFVEEFIGITYRPFVYAADDSGRSYFSYSADSGRPIGVVSTAGYRYVLQLDSEATDDINGVPYLFKLNTEMNAIEISKASSSIARVDLLPFLTALSKEPNTQAITPERMTLKYENENIALQVHFGFVGGLVDMEGIYTTNYIHSILLFTPKGNATGVTR